VSDELQTINPDQVPIVGAVPADAHVLIHKPGQQLQRVPHAQLLAKLTASGVIVQDEATLQADLEHDENITALVINDPDLLKNGWWRKTGASGAGEWEQFEELAKSAREAAAASAADAAVSAAAAEAYAAWPRGGILIDEAFFGDSRVLYNKNAWRTATSLDWKGLQIGYGFWSRDVTASTTSGAGTLEWRASDKHVRLTYSGDSAGAWTQAVAGITRVMSGNGTTYVDLHLNGLATQPATDQTISLGSLASTQFGWRADGAMIRANEVWDWPQRNPKVFGFGSATAAQLLENTPWVISQIAAGGQIDYRGWTNSISAGLTAAQIIPDLKAIFDMIRNAGLRLNVWGEPARWGSAVGTPMTAPQIAAFDGVREWVRDYCGGANVPFFDLYPITVDPANMATRQPLTAESVDTVHDSLLTAQRIGRYVGEAKRTLYGAGPGVTPNMEGNVWSQGAIGNTSGGSKSGIAGLTVGGVNPPNGWQVEAISGAGALTCALAASPEGPGDYKFTVSGTVSAASRLQIGSLGSSVYMPTTGLAVGDEVRLALLRKITVTAGNLDNIETRIVFLNSTPQSELVARRGTASSAGGWATESEPKPVSVMTPKLAIPSGSTYTDWVDDIYLDAGTTFEVTYYCANIIKEEPV
jgi:hypothetical protein